MRENSLWWCDLLLLILDLHTSTHKQTSLVLLVWWLFFSSSKQAVSGLSKQSWREVNGKQHEKAVRPFEFYGDFQKAHEDDDEVEAVEGVQKVVARMQTKELDAELNLLGEEKTLSQLIDSSPEAKAGRKLWIFYKSRL